MANQATKPALPMEVIYLIIDLFVPVKPSVILASSDPRTKTLVSFTKVCRATCALVSVYLWRHCVYIDSDARLQQFLQGLQTISAFSSAGEGRRNVSSMYLALPVHSPDSRGWRLGRLIENVFHELGGTLKRLVMDVPVERHCSAKFVDALHKGLNMLTELEELVAVNDDIFITYGRTRDKIMPMLVAWPKLRRLATCNPWSIEGLWPLFSSVTKLNSLLRATKDCAETDVLYFTQHEPCPAIAQQQSGIVADPKVATRLVYSIGERSWNREVGMDGLDDYPRTTMWEERGWFTHTAIQRTLWEWAGELRLDSKHFPQRPDHHYLALFL